MQQRTPHSLLPLFLASLAALTGLGAAASAQTTRNVPSQYATIQAGIDAALDGDTVLVAPGTYDENRIDFRGKQIVVKSSGGPEVTTIDGRKLDRVLFFLGGETASTVLEGFEIRGGRAITGSSGTVGAAGGAGLIDGTSPTIRDCHFWDNGAGVGNTGYRGGRAGALYVYDGASPTFERCLFRRNFAGTGGIGKTGTKGKNSSIAAIPGGDGGPGGSAGDGGDGGAVYVKSASATFLSCVFSDNTAGQGGTGGTGGRGGDGDWSTLLGIWLSNGGDGGNGGNGGASGSGSALYVDASSAATVVNGSIGLNYCFSGGGRGSGGNGGAGINYGSSGLVGGRGSEGEIALFAAAANDLTVQNSIVWGNVDQRSDQQLSFTAAVSYSNVELGFPGTGNIGANPLWDASNAYSNRNVLRTLDGSPCIDAGASSPWFDAASADFAGNPRSFEHPLLGSGSTASPAIDMGAHEFADGFAIPFGCASNPAGSLSVLAGKPVIGQAITLGVDNPLGTQAAGAVPVLLYSFSSQAGCGISLAGFGMANGAPGAFYLGLDDLDGIVGAPWAGSGTPAPIVAPLPSVSALVGLSLYVQGVLVGGGGVGLTTPLELYVGP